MLTGLRCLVVSHFSVEMSYQSQMKTMASLGSSLKITIYLGMIVGYWRNGADSNMEHGGLDLALNQCLLVIFYDLRISMNS